MGEMLRPKRHQQHWFQPQVHLKLALRVSRADELRLL